VTQCFRPIAPSAEEANAIRAGASVADIVHFSSV